MLYMQWDTCSGMGLATQDYDFVQSLLSFDDDVLILPDAVTTPIDDGPYISLRW